MLELDYFMPGQRVVVETPLSTCARFVTLLLGAKKDQFLILENPLLGGHDLNLDKGVLCVVRFLTRGQVIGFKSGVLAKALKPIPLLFLEYPSSVETLQLRKGKNYQVVFDVSMGKGQTEGPAADQAGGIMLNLSEGGCLVLSHQPVPFGQVLALTFDLPEVGQVGDLRAEVKNCQELEQGFYLDLVFRDQQGAAREALDEYLDRLEQRQLSEAMLRLSP